VAPTGGDEVADRGKGEEVLSVSRVGDVVPNKRGRSKGRATRPVECSCVRVPPCEHDSIELRECCVPSLLPPSLPEKEEGEGQGGSGAPKQERPPPQAGRKKDVTKARSPLDLNAPRGNVLQQRMSMLINFSHSRAAVGI